MTKLFSDIEYQFDLLVALLSKLEPSEYQLSNSQSSSIGAHIRHIIEYLEILINADTALPIDYSNRERNREIENDKEIAIEHFLTLKSRIRKTDGPLIIKNEEEVYQSSYLRELLYQHEHIVHHCAIIRMKMTTNLNHEIDPCFGFAKSTLMQLNSNVSS